VKASEKLEAHMRIEKLREMLGISDAMSSLVEMGSLTINAESESVAYLQEQAVFLNSLIARCLFLVAATKTTAVAALDLAESLAGNE
jgi:hypothetical protein